MTLVLIGHRGVGKTNLGRAVARALGLPFRDSDQELVEAHGVSTPAELGRRLGERSFREAEAAWLAAALAPAAPAALIALGAGAVEHPQVEQQLALCGSVALWLPDPLQQQRWLQKGIPWDMAGVDGSVQSHLPASNWNERVALRAAIYRRCATCHVVLEGNLAPDLDLLLQRVEACWNPLTKRSNGL